VGDMVDRWERYDGEALVVCAALFSLACVG
jgi:hypothetical protein